MVVWFFPLLLLAAATVSTASPLSGDPPREPAPQNNVPKTAINLYGLPVKTAMCFANYIRPRWTAQEFCAQGTEWHHSFIRNRVFHCVCHYPSEPNHVWPQQEMNWYIQSFNTWMDVTCGHHTYTNSGMEVVDMCGIF